MPIRIDVKGGTVKDEHLCLRCQNGSTRTTAHGHEETKCYQFGNINRQMIVKCDKFKAKEEPAPTWMLSRCLYIFNTPYGKTHFLTAAQYDDDNYRDNLIAEEGREYRLSKAAKVTTHKNPQRKRKVIHRKATYRKNPKPPPPPPPADEEQIEMFCECGRLARECAAYGITDESTEHTDKLEATDESND